jgi:hypothetical protein
MLARAPGDVTRANAAPANVPHRHDVHPIQPGATGQCAQLRRQRTRTACGALRSHQPAARRRGVGRVIVRDQPPGISPDHLGGRGLRPHRQRHQHRQAPQPPVRAQSGLAGRRADRRRPARLAQAAGPGRPLAKAEPAGGVSKSPPPSPGHRRSSPPGIASPPCPKPLTSPELSRQSRKEPLGPVEPRLPGPPAGSMSYPDPKTRSTTRRGRHCKSATDRRE